jgi:hypothetical protein
LGMGLYLVLEHRLREKTIIPYEVPLEIPSPWLWILFLLSLAFIRFYRLVTLPFWPIGDEGVYSSLAMGLTKHWRWNLLEADYQVESFFTWISVVFFKLLPPSLLSLRLLPTLISIVSTAGAYWAARSYFSQRSSFLFTCFMGFSFWDMTLSRFFMPTSLVPLLQCFCLGGLGYFLKSTRVYSRWAYFAFTLFISSLGFYACTSWLVIWLSAAFLLGLTAYFIDAGKKIYFYLFVGLTFILVLPMIHARFFENGGMDYIGKLFSLDFYNSITSYGTALFWDGTRSYPFGSNWGGLLNPVLTSLSLVGFLQILRCWTPFQITCSFGCFFLSLIPGLLSQNLELYRLSQTIPYVFLSATIGVQAIMIHRLNLRGIILAILLCLSSFGLDIYNYFYRYCDLNSAPLGQQWRIEQFYDAYTVLADLSRQNGSLYVFSEFNPDYDNKTLDAACYPFDVLQNPSLFGSKPRWAALICNSQYSHYLIGKFPGLRWKVLKKETRGTDNQKPFGIFIIPTSQIPPDMLAHWIKTDEIYRVVDFEIRNKRPRDLWAGFLESHPALVSLFPHDPFLTAVYWEKMGLYKFLDSHFLQASQAFQNAIDQGIPAANLYYNLAVCLQIQNKGKESENCLKKASALSNGVY